MYVCMFSWCHGGTAVGTGLICKSRHRSLEKSALAAFVDFGLQGVSKMAIQLDLAAEGFSSQVDRGWLVEFDFDVYGLFLFFQVL